MIIITIQSNQNCLKYSWQSFKAFSLISPGSKWNSGLDIKYENSAYLSKFSSFNVSQINSIYSVKFFA